MEDINQPLLRDRHLFRKTEYQQRLRRLQRQVKASGLEFFIARTNSNIIYLTGVDYDSEERKVLLIVPAEGEATLIVPRMELERLNQSISVITVKDYWEMNAKPGRGWAELLHQTLGSSERIGVEPNLEADIISELSHLQWSVSCALEDVRLIKSPAEIALTRRIAGYWTTAMKNMLKHIHVGKSVPELMCIGEEITRKIFGKEPDADQFNTNAQMVYATSPGSSVPHYLSMGAEDVIPHGSTVINALGWVNWYNAENERTVLVGKYSAEEAELFDITTRGHHLALDLIKPGVPCAEIDSQIQAFFDSQGVAQHMRHRVGHGFGMCGHERPYTSEGSLETYQPGMIISVEPGLYVEGVGGFRHSDTLLITKEGTENFSAAIPKDRVSMTF